MIVHSIAETIGYQALRYPRRTAALAVGVALSALIFTVQFLQIEPDRNALIRPGRDWNERFEAYRQNFDGTRDFLIVVRGQDQRQREAYVDELVDRLRADPYVESVFGRVNPTAFEGSRLVLMPPQELRDLQEQLAIHKDGLEAIGQNPSLESILAWVDRRISRALVSTVVQGLFESSEEKEVTSEEPTDLSFLLALLGGIRSSLEGEVPQNTPWKAWLGGNRRGYLTARDGTLHLIAVARVESGIGDGRMLDRLRSHLDGMTQSAPGLTVGITGQRAINVEEMRATLRDTRLAGIIALIGVSILFVIGFGSFRHALLAVVALVVGIAWSAGALTLVVGHLTVLSVAFTSILVGLGIDFGIHIVARFEEALLGGAQREAAARLAIQKSGPGNVAGALTTSLAFFGVGLSDFLGLAELGIIAGMGVLLCLVAQMTLLPVLLVWFGAAPSSTKGSSFRINLVDTYPAVWVASGVVLALSGYVLFSSIQFDGNLLHLQAEGVEAVKLELELVGDRSGVFAVSRVSTLERLRELEAQLKKLPEVSGVESIGRFVVEDPASRILAAKGLAKVLPKLETREASALRLPRLARRIEKLRFKLRPERDDKWEESKRPDADQLVQARSLLDEIKKSLPSGDKGSLNTYQTGVVKSFFEEMGRFRQETNAPRAPSLNDLPEALVRRLVGRDKSYLIRIYPEGNVWEDETKEKFVTALRRVDPEVTGVPIQSYEAARLMRGGYIQGGLYSLALVLIVLLVDLRRLDHVMLALTPLLVGGGCTLLIMVVVGLSLNLANLIIVPLMIGIGIDIGVHLIHRFRDDGQVGAALVTGSTGRAVIVSSLTTVVGFGSLAIAQHQGIHSLGVLLAIGVTANLGAATIVLAPGLSIIRRLNLVR